MKEVKKHIFIAMLVAQGLLMFIVESYIPYPFVVPGAKLGLSNIITVVSLYLLGGKDTFIVIILKIFLSTILTGNTSTFLYSFAGGVLSFFAMVFIKNIFREKVSIIGVSIVGGVFHNLGQILLAIVLLKSPSLIYYLPWLNVVGIITGGFIGVTSLLLLSKLKKIKFLL